MNALKGFPLTFTNMFETIGTPSIKP